MIRECYEINKINDSLLDKELKEDINRFLELDGVSNESNYL